MGFFTDTTMCIGCKACEVACKQWNDLPADGFEFRRAAPTTTPARCGASTWRHVRFVENLAPSPGARAEAEERLAAGGGGKVPGIPARAAAATGCPTSWTGRGERGSTWPRPWRTWTAGCSCPTSASTARNAGCLDACPTGAIIRTEFETVVIQADVCNGCGYCIPSCPFGVRRPRPLRRPGRQVHALLRPPRGRARAGLRQGVPDRLDPVRPLRRAGGDAPRGACATLHERGQSDAYLYGAGDEPGEELAGGLGAFFLLTEPPERFGLPAQAESPIQENVPAATLAGLAGAAAVAAPSARDAGHRRGRAGRGGAVSHAEGRPPSSGSCAATSARSASRDAPGVGTRGEPALAARRGGRGRGAGRRLGRRALVVPLRRATRATPRRRRAPRPSGAGGAAHARAASELPDRSRGR